MMKYRLNSLYLSSPIAYPFNNKQMIKKYFLVLLLLNLAFSHLNHHVHPERKDPKNTKNLYMLHPLHGVQLNPNSPVNVNGIIQISEGGNGKFQVDEESGILRLDRILATPVAFPINYGFLPRTLGQDNDALDVMVISSIHIPPMTLVNVRVLGVMKMIDTGEIDDKLIGVPEKDPFFTHYKELTDIPATTTNKIKSFFETYKLLDNKKVEVLGFFNKTMAFQIIGESEARYRDHFNSVESEQQ